ncbi:hypothetical protein D1872_291940 [compost metagenome]
MIRKNRANIGMPRIVLSKTGRIGNRLADFMRQILGGNIQFDRVTEALAHFGRSVGSYQPGGPTDQSLRLGKNRPVQLVETADDFTRGFQMGKLIVSGWNQRCLTEGNIRRLADRIT